MKPPDPRRVIAAPSKRREILVAVAVALVVLALVLAGIYALQAQRGQPSRNQLTGIIMAKHDSFEREELISVGRKGLHSREGESRYSFEMKVEPGGRVYEIPVTKEMYAAKKVGEQQSFIRPPSEQR